ncbi:MAG: DNA primase [Deltaproteobacteria bacterium]|nr:MAG: DNA primase [Deltaproteobacteria bacterium]
MRIPREIIDQIRERVDIVQVVQRHVSVQRRGSSYVGLCPFHGEKTPSFHVVPSKHLFHCFGCNATGDVFKFVMEMEGLSFGAAVRELAQSVGIEVPEREMTPEDRRAMKARASLYDVLEAAAGFYESNLWTRPEGAKARVYLEERGFTGEAARHARLGYAPDAWSALLDNLHQQGFTPKQAFDAGLAKERRQGDGYYDGFRDRVVFPIRDNRGRVIGFGGRILEGDGPKYLNSPETRLYEKSKVLYGMFEGRRAIQNKDRVIVVEGYFDVLALQAAGFEEAVATCGTALTPEHLERLRRMTSNVILLQDSDEAGSRAAEKALPLFLAAGLSPWRLMLPDAKDPDELIREHGPEAMEQALTRKEPLLEWVVRRRRDAAGRDTVSLDRVVEDLLPILVQLRSSAVSRVAGLLGLHEASLRRRVESAARTNPAPQQEEPKPRPPSGWTPRREIVHVLWLLVHRYGETADILARTDPAVLGGEPDEVRTTIARLMTGEPVAAILPDLHEPNLQRTVSAVVARDVLYTDEEAALGMCQVLHNLDLGRREQRMLFLESEVERTAREGDAAGMRTALEEMQTLKKTTPALERALLDRNVDAWLALQTPADPA